MKKIVLNIMALTGITLLVLSVIARIYGGNAICIDTIFQITVLSTLIQLGFLLTHRFDSQYPILEIMLDIAYTMFITLITGAVFQWNQTFPTWILVIMVFVVYLVGYLIDIYRTKEEVRIINELLQKRRENNSN